MLTTSKLTTLARRLPVATVLAALACGSAGRGSIVRQPGPADFDGVMVDIVNDNFYEARVYAIYAGGERHPLGSVNGNQRANGLTFPFRARPLVFEIHLVTGFQTWASYEIDVENGEYLELRLPPDFRVSGFFRQLPNRSTG